MRGPAVLQKTPVNTVSPKKRVRKNHSRWPMLAMIGEARGLLDDTVATLCSTNNRPNDKDVTPMDGCRNHWGHFRCGKRSRDTPCAKTNAEALRQRKNPGTIARLRFLNNVLMKDRHCLVLDTQVTQANDRVERMAVADMAATLSSTNRKTPGAGNDYDTQDRVVYLLSVNATPHVVPYTRKRRSAIDGRANRCEGSAVNQQVRKRFEAGFGWIETNGGMRNLAGTACR